MDCFKHKQVILVRTDLGMGKGKIAVQVAHASVSSAEQARNRYPLWWKEWMSEGQCKIAVKVSNEDEIVHYKAIADREKLPNFLIEDRGMTQIPPGSITALGIGPAPSDIIDKITGKLSLL